MLAQIWDFALVAKEEAILALPAGLASLWIERMSIRELNTDVGLVNLFSLVRFLVECALVPQMYNAVVVLGLVIIRDLTVAAVYSGLRALFEMCWQFAVGDSLSTLACDSSMWACPQVLDGVVILFDALVIVIILYNCWAVWACVGTSELLLLKLLLCKSVNWQEFCLCASNWTFSSMLGRFLRDPLLDTFATKCSLAFLAFHRLQNNL